MQVKVLRLFLLVAIVFLQVGCATEARPPDDNASVLEPVPSQDDSHGWGANLQSAPR